MKLSPPTVLAALALLGLATCDPCDPCDDNGSRVQAAETVANASQGVERGSAD
jgi:hypothetical protein